MAYSINNDGSSNHNDPAEFRFSSNLNLEDIRAGQHRFGQDRNWEQYHTPRNVLLAMVGEVGELAEIFQWKGEVEKGLPQFTPAEKQHVGEEISDILLYLVKFAAQCHVDLPSAVQNKMQKNAIKYPIGKSFDHCKKYNNLGNDKMSSITPTKVREEGDGSE